MAKTLLQIGNNVLTELQLPTVSSFIGNNDVNAALIVALLNESGEEIRDLPEGGWTFFRSEFNLIVNTPVTTTGNITQNSAVITNIQPNTNGLTAGIMAISGNGIPVSSRIKSVDSSSQVTMTMAATSNATSEAILFGQDMYALSSDFKAFINRTFWDRTNHWELLGPTSPQMDQWHKSGIVATGPRRYFRILGHLTQTFQIWPPPFEIANPVQFAMEYFSNAWVNVNGAGTTTASAFTSDTDTTFIDDRALIKWCKWKFQQAKGMAFDVFRNDAIDFVKTLIARDGAAETLMLAKRYPNMFLSPTQVQDGNFPGPISSNTN